jgi:hypothetical protein
MMHKLWIYAFIVAVFFFRWMRGSVEPIESFYKRLCSDTPTLTIFLDPMHRVRDCGLGGSVVDELAKDNQYFDETTKTIKTDPFCEGGDLVVFDGTHHRLCLPHQESKLLTRFKEYNVSTVPCFNKHSGTKVPFNKLDFDRNMMRMQKWQGDQLGGAYFVCDGRDGISHVEFCPSEHFLDESECASSTQLRNLIDSLYE